MPVSANAEKRHRIMRNTFLTFILIMTIKVSFTQTSVYHPFPDSNTICIGTDMTYYEYPCFIFDDYNILIKGDTSVGSYIYHKLYRNGHKWSNCPPPGFYYYNEYFGAFRQDAENKKVYLLGNNELDTLAYDFNLNVGDTLPPTCLNWDSQYYYVESIDSVLVDNNYRKRFWISNDYLQNFISLIEGIGSDHGPFSPFRENWTESSNDLWCVYKDNDTIWNYYPNGYGCQLLTSINNLKTEPEIQIYPNPFSNYTHLTIAGNYTNITLTIYNSFGQKLKENFYQNGQSIRIDRDSFANGLYFVQIRQNNKFIMTKKLIIKD